MDSYVKNITLDVDAEENYTMIKAKQGDKINRKLAITLKKDGANFTPSGVSEIWFRVEKPDKNVVIVKSTDSGSSISVNGNVYTVDLTEQCLAASGEAWCDIAFLDDSGNTLSSAAFVMKIIPMPNGDSARSSSAWTDLQNAIDNIESIVQEQLQPAIDDAERFADILAFRVSNGYIQYTVDSETWINLMPSSSVGSPDSNTVPNRSEVSGETVSQALNWLKNNGGGGTSDEIANESTVTGQTVTQALNWLKNNSGATSDDITNESAVTGQTVTDALDNLYTDKAPLSSPTFTGTPTSPTPESTDNSTKIATTAFIKALLSNLSSGDIDDDSTAGGTTVKASLSLLRDTLNSITPFDTTPTSGSSKGITSGAVATAFDMLKISGVEAYRSLSDVASYLSDFPMGYMAIVRIVSTAASVFFEAGTAKPTLCFFLKASSTNAYFLATTQDNISIGNLNVTTSTITSVKDLAIADNSLGLNSSITYPAYLTTGLWRTGNDGTINLSFPCTSLKESTNYTTTSEISLNIFLPGSADAATQALNKAITNVERITTDYIVLQIAAIEGIPANRIGFFSTRTAMTITAS